MTKSVFVTGAASGIGRATALRFASRGYFVGLFDVNAAGVAALGGEIGSDKSMHGALDVTDAAAVRAAVEAFGARTGGRMDVLFLSAGVLDMGPFADIPHERAMRLVDINIKGVLNGVYAALPLLERTERSVLVTMGSASGVYGTPELAVYSATKFFVRGLTEALDIELRPRGVRVIDIMPSYVATPMVTDQPHKAASVERLGVRLVAEDLARVVVSAVESPPVGSPHVIPQFEVKLLRRLSGLLPEAGRLILRITSKL